MSDDMVGGFNEVFPWKKSLKKWSFMHFHFGDLLHSLLQISHYILSSSYFGQRILLKFLLNLELLLKPVYFGPFLVTYLLNTQCFVSRFGIFLGWLISTGTIHDLDRLAVSDFGQFLLEISLKLSRMTCQISLVKFTYKQFSVLILGISCEKYHIQTLLQLFIALTTI